MAKKIQLSIAEPCHENWDAMTPVDKGKFCGSCQKQVVDFSNMSDRQIAEFFKKPTLGSVCGRFMTDQLDRPMEIPRKRIPWLKYFFQVAIPAFLVSLKASANRTQGKIKIDVVATDTSKPVRKLIGNVSAPVIQKPLLGDTIVIPVKEPEIFLKGEIAINIPQKDTVVKPECSPLIMGGIMLIEPVNKKAIEGVVINSKGDYVPYATIEIGTSGQHVMADEKGNFSIKRNFIKKDESELIISSVSYEIKKMIVSRNYYGKLIIQLKENITLPGVTLATLGNIRRETTLGGAVMKIVTQTVFIDKSQPTVKENALIVYPNPATAGASVNISLKDPEEGYYQLQFLNQSGQVLRQQEVWIDAEARLMNTEIPVVSAGTYVMVLTNKKTGKKFSEKFIVQ